MEFWQQVLALTLTPVIVVAAGAYIVRKVLERSLERDLERFKNELELQRIEFQTRFSLIHEKRAEVIGDLYERIVRVNRILFGVPLRLESIPNPLEVSFVKQLSETKEKAAQIGNLLLDYYYSHKIFLDRDVCYDVENVIGVMREAWHSIDNVGKGGVYKPEDIMEWSNKWRKVCDMLPPLQAKLERRFRSILAAKDVSEA